MSDVEANPHSASGCELVAEIAKRFGEARFRAIGASMMPTIRPGDILTIQSDGAECLNPGQIVLFQRDGSLVAHRILEIAGEQVRTRGDSVGNADTPITKSEIVGRVVSVTRRGRSVPFHPGFWRGAGSYVLRHSDFCLRAAMFVARGMKRSRSEKVSWA